MKWVYNDGGRKAAGRRGNGNDCVIRAIAIATERPYQQIVDLIEQTATHITDDGRTSGAQNGVFKQDWKPLILSLGWRWFPCMGIGTGCRVHLRDGQLPMGRLIVRTSRHLVAVIDGVIHDTFDPSRNGTRCVYGYFTKGGTAETATV